MRQIFRDMHQDLGGPYTTTVRTGHKKGPTLIVEPDFSVLKAGIEPALALRRTGF